MGKGEVTCAFDSEYLRNTRMLLHLIGRWPFQRRRIKATAWILCTLFTWCPMPALVLGASKLSVAPLVAVCRAGPPILTLIGNVAKYNIYTVFDKEWASLIKEVEVDWLSIRQREERGILLHYHGRGSLLVSFYSKYIIGTGVALILLPIQPVLMDYFAPLNESRQRTLVFPLDYGWNDNSENMYWLVYWHTNLTIIMIIFVIIGADSMYFSMVHHICGLLAITGHRLQSISQNQELQQSVVNGNKIPTWMNTLIDGIRLHKRSIWYVSVLETCLTWPFFALLSVNMLIVSITGMLVIARFEIYEESIPATCFAIGQLIHLFFMCLPGQTLIDTSSAVRDLAYNSNWYTIPPNAQRLLILVMARALEPSKITAGKFFLCKMETFSSVIQTSVSYMTVLASFQ